MEVPSLLVLVQRSQGLGGEEETEVPWRKRGGRSKAVCGQGSPHESGCGTPPFPLLCALRGHEP